MLTTAEVTAMRLTLDSSLPDLCDIERATVASDGRGGFTETWAAVESDVACRIAPDTTRAEVVVGDRLTNTQRWMVTLPAGQDVVNTDRIVSGSRTFTVVDVRSARSFEVSCRVVCVEVL